MPAQLPIGDFSRATQLSVKTLRHYHRVGLLEPAAVDPGTGHRRYGTDQIPVAQVIRRFRALDMPIEDVRAVIATSDVTERNELIAAHLSRLEHSLARTQEAAASLRELLRPTSPAGQTVIEHRSVPPASAAAIRQIIGTEDLSAWFQGAIGELHATLAAQKIGPEGPAGGVFATDLFADDRGEAMVFVPCPHPVRATGRIEPVTVPPAELAIVVHSGSHNGIDLSYGSLATYVAEHALGVDGPVREYYAVSSHDTQDESQWRTEIGWPVFRTDPAGRARL